MKHCFLVLLLLSAVSGCNFSDCFNAEDINSELITENVPMKPERLNVNDNTTLWYASNYVLRDSEITISINSVGATLCDEQPVIVEKAPKHTSITLLSGDKVAFGIQDAYTAKIDDATCNGLNKNFYTADPDRCKNGTKDERGNIISSPLKGSNYGAKFTADINSENVVFDPKYKSKIENFFSMAKDVPLFSTESSNTISDLNDGKFDDIDPLLKISKNKIEYVCKNINKDVIFSSITRKISLENLATACRMICDTPIGTNKNDSTVVDSDCFYVVSLYKNKQYNGEDDAKEYGMYLNGVKVTTTESLSSFRHIVTNAFSYGMLHDALILDALYDFTDDSYDSLSTHQSQFFFYTLSAPLEGSYKISAKRSCDSNTEKSLYYYVGNSVPTVKPGENGTINIPFVITDDNTYTIPSDATGNVYFGIKDNGDGYQNNSGYLKIQARIPIRTPDIFSSIVRDIRDMVLRIFYGSKFGYDEKGKPLIDQDDVDGAVGLIFRAIISSPFISITKALIVLYIALFGVAVLIGLVRTPHVDFLIMVLKISVVLTMFSSSGWKFLSDNLFYWFIYGTSDLITAFSGDFSGGVDFKFIDASLGRFYKYQTWFQIVSLLLAGPVGWLVMFIILFGIFAFFSAMFRAIVTYIISMTLIALLLSISPIFITMIFFKKTKAIFDAWIKNLAQITIQPVFIMCTIAFLAQVMNGIMYGLFSYGVCTGCIINLELGNLDPMCVFSFLLPYGFNPFTPVGEHIRNTYNGYSFLGIPIQIANVISFAVLAHAIEKFTEQASTMVTSIFGAFGADISDPAEKFVQSAKSTVGKDDLSVQNKAQQKHQKKRNKPE